MLSAHQPLNPALHIYIRFTTLAMKDHCRRRRFAYLCDGVGISNAWRVIGPTDGTRNKVLTTRLVASISLESLTKEVLLKYSSLWSATGHRVVNKYKARSPVWALTTSRDVDSVPALRLHIRHPYHASSTFSTVRKEFLAEMKIYTSFKVFFIVKTGRPTLSRLRGS